MNPYTFPEDTSEFDRAHRVAYLVASFLQEDLSPAEREELDQWIEAHPDNLVLFEELISDKNRKASLKWFRELDLERARKRVHAKLDGRPANRGRKLRILPYAIAASAILIAGTAIWWLQRGPSKEMPLTSSPSAPSAAATGITLTMGNGTAISLDTATGGTYTLQDGTTVELANGLLRYVGSARAAGARNTIVVPTGRQFQLQLSDGTKVWLNAGSRLSYPVAFSGSERRVELEGEGYFEVAHKEAQPFHVAAIDADITVLGTRFNVQAYPQSGPVETTLLQGSVQVAARNDKVVLRPGERARIANDGKAPKAIQVTSGISSDKTLDWKEGYFIFRDDHIEDILLELAHWYGVQVTQRSQNEHLFTGTFPRTTALPQLLAYLEGTGHVSFKLEGTNVTVLP